MKTRQRNNNKRHFPRRNRPPLAAFSTHLHELLQTGQVDAEAGPGARWPDVLLYIGSVHEGQVDLLRYVGGREDHHVRVSVSQNVVILGELGNECLNLSHTVSFLTV